MAAADKADDGQQHCSGDCSGRRRQNRGVSSRWLSSTSGGEGTKRRKIASLSRQRKKTAVFEQFFEPRVALTTDRPQARRLSATLTSNLDDDDASSRTKTTHTSAGARHRYPNTPNSHTETNALDGAGQSFAHLANFG